MSDIQLTQVGTDTVVLSSLPAQAAGNVPLETKGNLALLGTIQALSSVTEEVAPAETEDSTTYTATTTEDTSYGTSTSDTLSHKGLIGGSALSMSSLSVIDMQRYLLLISYNAMEESWLSNEVLNDTAQQQYSLSMDAAIESYKSGIAQANSELTAAITSGITAAGTGALAGYELSNMSSEASYMAKNHAEQRYFRQTANGEERPEKPCPDNPIGIGDPSTTALRDNIKEALINNRGRDLSSSQRAAFRSQTEDEDTFNDSLRDAKTLYDNEKIADINTAMKSTGPGTLNTPEFTNTYGDIDIYHDPVAQYGLRKAADDMSPEEFDAARTHLRNLHTDSKDRFDMASSRLSQGSTILREAMDSIKNGIQSQFATIQAEHKKTSDEENAEASLEKSISDQFSALQSTWRSLNSTFYDQAMSLLPSQMAALVKANSLS